jgi:hypothetical protein
MDNMAEGSDEKGGSSHITWKSLVDKVLRLIPDQGESLDGVLLMRKKYWVLLSLPTVPKAGAIRSERKEWEQSAWKGLSFSQFLAQVKYPYLQREVILSEEEKKDYQCSVIPIGTRARLLRHGSQDPLSEGQYLYVLGSDRHLYVGQEKEWVDEEGTTWYFKHMALSGGKGIQTAGELQVDSEGFIIETAPKSGHYRPNEQAALRFSSFLETKGVDLQTIHFAPIARKSERESTH